MSSKVADAKDASMSICVIWNFLMGVGWRCPSTRQLMWRGAGVGAAGVPLLENNVAKSATAVDA
jgi:hypothetical protein